MILYMYITPGQRLKTPSGRNFDVNRNTLSLRSFVASFITLSLKPDFIGFFHYMYVVIAPGQGSDRQPPGDKVSMSTEMSFHFIHVLQVSKNVFEVWFYTIFFNDLIHVYSPGGQNVHVNRKALSLYPFVASFKELSLKFDFLLKFMI